MSPDHYSPVSGDQFEPLDPQVAQDMLHQAPIGVFTSTPGGAMCTPTRPWPGCLASVVLMS